jgi:hypothetical protein
VCIGSIGLLPFPFMACNNIKKDDSGLSFAHHIRSTKNKKYRKKKATSLTRTHTLLPSSNDKLFQRRQEEGQPTKLLAP